MVILRLLNKEWNGLKMRKWFKYIREDAIIDLFFFSFWGWVFNICIIVTIMIYMSIDAAERYNKTFNGYSCLIRDGRAVISPQTCRMYISESK